MAITQDDFKKVWASTSSVPKYTFSDSDYQDGWEFVGNLPPTRAMWDALQRRNDQKMKYLQDNGSMCFDSVADMISTDLEAGQTVITKGYYSVNDGGSALYTIRAKDVADVDDGGSIIFLDNGNVAELINDGTVTPEQFGAKGDGVVDDTIPIRNAVNAVKHVILNKNYLVSVDNGTTIISLNSGNIFTINGTITLKPNDSSAYNIISISDLHDVVVNGCGQIIGDKDTHTGSTGEWGKCIFIGSSTNVTIDGVHCSKSWGDGINIGVSASNTVPSNVRINNVEVYSNRRNGLGIGAGTDIVVTNAILHDNSGLLPNAAFDIEPNDDYAVDIYMDNIIIKNNNFYISNYHSNDFNVRIGRITCEYGFNTNLTYPSNVIIDDITCDCKNSDAGFMCIANADVSKLTIKNACLTGDIKYIYTSGTGIQDSFINIDNMVIQAKSLYRLGSGTPYLNINIGNLYVDVGQALTQMSMGSTNLTIGKIHNAQTTTISSDDTLSVPIWVDRLITNNKTSTMLTIFVELGGLSDGEEMFVINSSEGTGGVRLATTNSSQAFVKNGTASNTFVLTNGNVAKLQYNKGVNKFVVIYDV